MSSHYARDNAVIPVDVATPRTTRVGELVQKNGALATANANILGATVFAENPLHGDDASISVAVAGGIGGTVPLIASVAIEKGDRLTAAAAGKVAVATGEYIGTALQDAAIDEVFEATLHPTADNS